jgi:5-methylcytosine-specific restriction enzyme subunit McrC
MPEKPRGSIVVNLEEQHETEVLLLPEEATFLREKLGFEVFSCKPANQIAAEAPTPDSRSLFAVNPLQYVGHFILATGTTISIRPKIPAANVFKMLAYVYACWTRELFQESDVLYADDDFVFEPLVQLFNQLVAKRARHGLLQDYIRTEDNLRVLKGAISFSRHIRDNVPAHPDHVFCRYYENTFDIEDNQIIKFTLQSLMPFAPTWSVQTVRLLRANFHQFEGVSLKRPDAHIFDRRHYHRLNDDYRLIHGLCRLFLDSTSISEKPGEITFRGFRLDMNVLFETFVTEAFIRAAKGTTFDVRAQKSYLLSEMSSAFPVTIIPDITVSKNGVVDSIVDAKYKKTDSGFANHDFYQALSYGIGLDCPRTYLFYPTSEYAKDGQISIRHSSVTVDVRRVDLGDRHCVELMERSAALVLGTSAHEPATSLSSPYRP